MRFAHFDWDERNVDHILLHQVTPDEAEEACLNRPHVRRTRQGRLLVYGQTDTGRYLLVVVEPRGHGVARIITARDMTTKEKSFYRQQRKMP
jgi:uncharacterized DUF497 family protein